MFVAIKSVNDQDYYEHAYNLKAKKLEDRKHIEARERIFREDDKVMANRKACAIKHENQMIQNKIANNKALDDRMQFLKNSHLNII